VKNNTLFEFNVQTISNLLACYEIDNDLDFSGNAVYRNASTMFMLISLVGIFIVFIIIVFQVIRSET